MQTGFRWTSDGLKLLKNLKELDKLEVFVGYQQGQPEKGGKEYKDVTVCDVAAFNELGTSTIPSRPFIRDSVEKHRGELKRRVEASLVKVLLLQSTPEQCLSEIGEYQVKAIQKEIRYGSFIPNAPSTIRAKKSSTPLIDTGRMRQSVLYVVRPEGSSGSGSITFS